LQDNSVKEQLLQEGAEPIGGSAQQFKKYIQSELDKTINLFNQQKLVPQ
jgi:tripartite-type tricarboxylate transporter receptor subunit TctC